MAGIDVTCIIFVYVTSSFESLVYASPSQNERCRVHACRKFLNKEAHFQVGQRVEKRVDGYSYDKAQ